MRNQSALARSVYQKTARFLLRLALIFVGILVLGIVDALTTLLHIRMPGSGSADTALPGLLLVAFFLVYMVLMLMQPRLASWSRRSSGRRASRWVYSRG